MRQLLSTLGFLILLVAAVLPCFANGTSPVTSLPIGSFAGWAAATNAKVLVGDFNGDGKTDLAITGPAGWNNLPVAFSNGDGTFNVTNSGAGNFPGWAATTNAKILVGDFNADGKADLAVTGPSGWNNLPVAFSNGDGTFNVTNSAPGNFPGYAATANAKVLVGDYNGDKKADLAITGPASWTNLPVAFSNGDGTFNVTNSGAGNFPGWASTTNAQILVGDYNGDKKADLAISGPSGWNNMPVAFSNGDGTFNVTNSGVGNFQGWAATPNAKILVGDFNADGKSDVAITGPSGWNNLPVAFSNGNGTFNVTNQPISNFDGWAATANATTLVGDYNGDGKADLAITGPTGWNNLPVAFSKGDGTFNVTNQPVGSFNIWAATVNAKTLVGDYNGDGKADLAITGPSGWNNVPVAFSNGDGTFNVKNQPTSSSSVRPLPRRVSSVLQ